MGILLINPNSTSIWVSFSFWRVLFEEFVDFQAVKSSLLFALMIHQFFCRKTCKKRVLVLDVIGIQEFLCFQTSIISFSSAHWWITGGKCNLCTEEKVNETSRIYALLHFKETSFQVSLINIAEKPQNLLKLNSQVWKSVRLKPRKQKMNTQYQQS